MWKTLRNLTLAVVLLAGMLKLLAWYAVGQDLPRVLSELAPYVRLDYAKLSTDLNGDITLTDVKIHPHQNARYHAEQLVFSGPNLFWLVKHSLLHENSLPDNFTVSATNLKFPAFLSWLHSPWIDTHTFVPFPDMGCGGTVLGPANYREMGVHADINHAELDYRYDDTTRKLDLGVVFSVPGFSRSTARAELRNFNPEQFRFVARAGKLHLEQISADYTDLGYLKRRTHYCAVRQGVPEAQFVDEHVNDVVELLHQHGIRPSDTLTQLYRRLVQQGGSVSALSLPTRDFVFGDWNKIGRDAAWRQLNVTVRYQTSPPIMFGLQFDPAAPTSSDSVAATQIAAGVGPLIETPAPRINTPAPVRSAPPHLPVPVLTTPHVALPSTATLPNRRSGPSKSTLPRGTDESAVLHGKNPALQPMPNDSHLPVVPSIPRPPPGSTLALVWQPAIDELPAPAPPKRNYTVIGFDQLSHEIGRRVRLLTGGENKVEGVVLRVDDDAVRLLIERGDGSAKFDVRRSRIKQIQLLHR